MPKEGEKGFALAAAIESYLRQQQAPRYPRAWYARMLRNCAEGVGTPNQICSRESLTPIEDPAG